MERTEGIGEKREEEWKEWNASGRAVHSWLPTVRTCQDLPGPRTASDIARVGRGAGSPRGETRPDEWIQGCSWAAIGPPALLIASKKRSCGCILCCSVRRERCSPAAIDAAVRRRSAIYQPVSIAVRGRLSRSYYRSGKKPKSLFPTFLSFRSLPKGKSCGDKVQEWHQNVCQLVKSLISRNDTPEP